MLSLQKMNIVIMVKISLNKASILNNENELTSHRRVFAYAFSAHTGRFVDVTC